MEQNEFDELMHGAREIGKHLIGVYRDVTGEDLDLESAIRHYPLLVVGLAAGAGAVGGWFFARRSMKQLPPPPPPPKQSPSAREYVERFLPESLGKVRDMIPEEMAEEAAASARHWLDEVLEPKFKEGVDNAVSGMKGTRIGDFFKQTIERLDSGEERQLDDPD